MTENIINVVNLKKYFEIGSGFLKKGTTLMAVDRVSFEVKKGETLGLVGESGCGKTTLGLTILGLYDPTAGEVFFEGENIFQLGRREMKKLRREMQIIFQDPFSSLDPRMSVYNIVGEGLEIHDLAKGEEKKKRVLWLLEKVGLLPEHLYLYPHEFSGGQKQRIGIARALATNPKFLIADEPVSSIDVSVRAQILNLLQDLKDEFKLTLMFISHDLGVVRHVCDRIAVMYLGRIVEIAKNEDFYNNPLHPYTQALLSAIPIPDPDFKSKRIILTGDVPTPINPPKGCRFHPRCPYAEPICSETVPELLDKEGKDEHFVSCHFSGELIH